MTGPTAPAAPDKNQLAMDRTFLALERTLMAWIRTATSLITFGFTLYKFFAYLHQQDPARYPDRAFGAMNVGTLMIGIGLVSLGLAAVQHRQQLKRVGAHYSAPPSLAQWVAVLVALLGGVALVGTVLQQ